MAEAGLGARTPERIAVADLEGTLRERGLSNGADRRMERELVDLLGECCDYEYDLYEFLRAGVQGGEIETRYESLTGIHTVGQKKASLVLRDLVHREGLADALGAREYVYVFPVDTWVAQVVRALGIQSSDVDGIDVEAVVDACEGVCSPIAFNQGAWYIGSNAFGVLLDNLDALVERR